MLPVLACGTTPPMKRIMLRKVQQIARYGDRDGRVSIQFLDADGEEWDIDADPDEIRALSALLEEAVERLDTDSF